MGVIVINPNSTQSVTQGIATAVAPLSHVINVKCETLAQGPAAIESDQDCLDVVAPLVDRIKQDDGSTCAWVIACYSDPGIDAARAASDRPVFGIAESAMLTALSHGRRFGVISILDKSIPRHHRYVENLGLTSRMAGDRAVGLGVLELEQAPDAIDRMIATGTKLRDIDGADVLVLGCAGMALQRAAVEDALGIPVIEPCQAAVNMATGAAMIRGA